MSKGRMAMEAYQEVAHRQTRIVRKVERVENEEDEDHFRRTGEPIGSRVGTWASERSGREVRSEVRGWAYEGGCG